MNSSTWLHRGWGRLGGLALALALSGAALTLAPQPARAQAQTQDAGETQRLRAEVARLKRDVQRAESEIRRTDSLTREEQAASARTRERLTRDRERREKENAALEARVREARGRIAAEKARGDGYVNATGEEEARGKAVLTLLALVADSLTDRVEAGIPWDNETRRERILSLRRDLEAGTASPEEAFARLGALLREETKGGDEVTLSSRPLTRKNGEVINAQVLKIGNQAILYVDEDGKKFGILERADAADGTTKWSWREDLNLSERTAVKRAVAVKAGRDTPQLAALSVPLAGLALRNAPVATDSATTESPVPADSTTNNAAADAKGGR